MSIAKNIKNFKVLPSVLSQSTSTTSRIKSTRLCGGRTARPQTRRKVIYGGVVMDTETSNVKVPSDNSLSLSEVSGVKRILIDLTDGDTERVNVRLDKGTDTTTVDDIQNSSVSETATTKLINDLKKINEQEKTNEPENTIDKLQKINENINISETEPTAQIEESPEFATETSTEKLPEFTTETSTEESTEPDTTVQVDESEKPESETQTEEATESDTAQSEESSDVEQSKILVQDSTTTSEPIIIPDTTTTTSDMVSKTVDKADSAFDSRRTISTQLGGKSDYSAFIDKLFTQTVGGKKRVYSQKAIELNDKTTEIIKSVYPNITHEELKAVRSEIYQHIRDKYDPEVFRTLKDYEKAELLLKATTPSVLRKIDIEQAVIDRKRRIEERFNSDEETPAMSKKTASKKTTTKKATTKKTATKKATTKKATTKKETKTSKATEKLKKKKSTRGGADLELPFHI